MMTTIAAGVPAIRATIPHLLITVTAIPRRIAPIAPGPAIGPDPAMPAAPLTPIIAAPADITRTDIMHRLGTSPESARRIILDGRHILVDISRRMLPLHRYDPDIMSPPGMIGRVIVYHALAERQSGTP